MERLPAFAASGGALEGPEGEAISECLLSGRMPDQDLINHLLIRAGLLLKPAKK